MILDPSSDLTTLPTPALCLDLDVVRRNVGRMAERCRRLGVRLRPHAKTHKSPAVAALQREAGAVGLTVSTLVEARAFIDAGWTDLTWAFPFVPGRVEEARALAERATLRLVIDSEEALEELEASGFPFPVLVEVDSGQRRSGVDPEAALVLGLVRRLTTSKTLRYDGILTHAGQSYAASGRDALRRVAEAERRTMVDLAERLREDGVPPKTVSVGSTPAMSVVEDLEGVTEVRCGNYVFHDLTQVALGACREEEIGVSVLATVVSSSAEQCVIDAGALALSKDLGLSESPSYGKVVGLDGRAAGIVAAVTQEHGIVSTSLPRGTRVRVLPNHSCLTVACHDRYAVVSEGRVVDHWPIDRRR